MFNCYYCKYFIFMIINHKKVILKCMDCFLIHISELDTQTSYISLSIVSIDTYWPKEPPPKSKIRRFRLPWVFLSSPRDGDCGRLVNDPPDVQGGDEVRVLTLRVIEVRRNHDHISDGCAQVSFRSFLHLGRNHWGDLFGEERFHFALVIIRNE